MPTGTISVDPSSVLEWGGHVSFDAAYRDAAKNAKVYITVVAAQNGSVEYQWSSSDLDFEFPLTDQLGDGLDVDPTMSADATAVLIHRVKKGKEFVFTTLDEVRFTIEPGG